MISLEDAFNKFLGRLELTANEQKDVSNRHTQVRVVVRDGIAVERDILTGSYKRHTKTKPLKDVDIFFILKESERAWLDQHPDDLLRHVKKILENGLDGVGVSLGRRSVKVDFGIVAVADMTDEQVMSVDVVPAFADGADFLIGDRNSGEWMKTNPEVHAELAIDANSAYGGRWKALVRMIKKWNDHQGKPVKPSFLLEVMALGILDRGFGGHYSLELQTFFNTAAERIEEQWADPAGLGAPVSDRLESDPSQRQAAANELRRAGESVVRARLLANQGKNGEALRVWRDDVFGPLFPLS